MRTVAIIQARMGSSRLPGKVLEPLGGKTLLAQTVDRARAIQGLAEVVVATTQESVDDAIVEHAEAMGVAWARGSEHDVLSRYAHAARRYDADIVVRITSDCPLLDPNESQRVIESLVGSEFHYASNTIERTYPRGLDTEAFTRDALELCDSLAKEPREREHVTLYMYEHPSEFRLHSVRGPQNVSQHRWTVDTREDLQLVREIYARLGPSPADSIFGMRDILALLEREPWIAELNSHIEQKRA